jgi:hypothetical protein
MNAQEIVEKAINELRDEYLSDEDEFFNEHDFHHLFFCKLYPNFKHLIHPEYPTRNRFIRNKGDEDSYKLGKHSFQPEETNKGVRGHYDFVIFNEKFYNEHKESLDRFERLSNKNVNTNIDRTDQYINFAFEFKYVTSGSKSFVEEIEFDIFKLNEANEVKNKYIIVFIKKSRFSQKGFNQIIEPLTKYKESEKDINITIVH